MMRWALITVVCSIIASNVTGGFAYYLARKPWTSEAQDGALVLIALALGAAAYLCGFPTFGTVVCASMFTVASVRTFFRQQAMKRQEAMIAAAQASAQAAALAQQQAMAGAGPVFPFGMTPVPFPPSGYYAASPHPTAMPAPPIAPPTPIPSHPPRRPKGGKGGKGGEGDWN